MMTGKTPQTLDQALVLTGAFASEQRLAELQPAAGRGAAQYSGLLQEKNHVFPPELKRYLQDFAPRTALYFTQVGNPIELWPLERLSWHLPGYNFNPVQQQPIAGWDENWFLIADEGADPIMVDLREQGEFSRVYRAMHGAGCWDFAPVADSIGQFLLIASALHHALDEMDIDEPIEDDGQSFNLTADAAGWLFPLMRRHAPGYYDDWLSVFDNA